MTTTTDSHRLTSTENLAFVASDALTAHLQAVLADLIELHLQGKQFHWNLVGANFRDLHRELDEIVGIARDGADTIAERMRALAAEPDGRTDTVARTTTLPQAPTGTQDTSVVAQLVTARIVAAVATARRVHDAVDAEDPSSADLLHGIIDDLEKHSWMLSAETRRPR